MEDLSDELLLRAAMAEDGITVSAGGPPFRQLEPHSMRSRAESTDAVSSSVKPSQSLALTTRWWVRWRDYDPVRSALVTARAVYLDKVIQDSIAKNRKDKRSPRSLAELSEMLDRDITNVFRWRRGLSEPTITDMSSLAELLNVPIAVLFPQKLEFLTNTVNILCKGKLRRNDILAYTEYLLLCDKLINDINIYTNYIDILNYTDSNALYTRAISTAAEPAGRTGEAIYYSVNSKSS